MNTAGASGDVKRIRLKSKPTTPVVVAVNPNVPPMRSRSNRMGESSSLIIQGDVFESLPRIPPGSIDCAVTSPPYWMLRSYLPKDHPLKHLELGQEKTPQEYVANVVRWCGLVRNCLAPHGTLWLNVGDTYSATGKSGGNSSGKNSWAVDAAEGLRSWNPAPSGIPAGNLCLIPQRLAIALQEDGWFVRSVVVWRKPSCMPDSITGWQWRRCRVKARASVRAKDKKAVASNGKPHGERNGKDFASTAEWTDCPGCKKCNATGGYVLRRGSWRPTSSWEPILMLAKSATYFADGELVKTPPAVSTINRDKYTRVIDDPDEQFAVAHDHETICDDGAKLRDVWQEDLEKLTKEQLVSLIMESSEMGDVWTIPFEPLKEKHYAAYPSELVRRCLAIGVSEEGYCHICGGPFVRVVDDGELIRVREGSNTSGDAAVSAGQGQHGSTSIFTTGEKRVRSTTGWRPSCKCENAYPRPGRVLDPFCGSGRTGIAARRMFLDFVGIELNPDFTEMGKKQIHEDQPLFNHVATEETSKPTPQPGLFDEIPDETAA